MCYVNALLTGLLCKIYLVLALILRYAVLRKVKRLEKKCNGLKPKNENFFKTTLVLELLVCSVFLPPYISITISGSMLNGEYTYHIGEILFSIMLIRAYLVLRLYEHYSEWTSSSSRSTCKKYSTTCNAMFAMKSDLKIKPFLTIGVIMTIIVIILGIAIMEAEKGFNAPNSLNQLTNNEWLVIVTMATIGYGDFFPSTHQGRFYCIIGCIAGMILSSALIVALHLTSEFSEEQKVAYLKIKEVQRGKKYFASAANVIKSAFRMKNEKKYLKKYKLALLLKKDAFEFERVWKGNNTLNVTSTEMLHELKARIEENLEETRKKIVNVPGLNERCKKINQVQFTIEEKVRRIMVQQVEISEYFYKNYSES